MSSPATIPPRTIFADLRSVRNVAIDRRVPRDQRRKLVRDFLAMRLRSMLPRRGEGVVRVRLLGFEVRAFDFPALLFLFDEIFVFQCYRVALDGERPLILDCGANIGMATLFFKSMAPEARIISFEPDPATFELLAENVRENHLSDVEPRNQALWKEEGEIEFHVGDHPGSLRMSVLPRRMIGRKVAVKSIRLSPLLEELERVDLLKLDVEGSEDAILEELDESGALGNVREWLIEYHHRIGGAPSRLAGFLARLERWGYEYQIDARGPGNRKDAFQDISIHAYRSWEPACAGTRRG